MTLMIIEHADIEDIEEVLNLQKQCYLSEARIYDDDQIPPLTQTIDDIKNEFSRQVFYKVVVAGKIIASARAFLDSGTCFIGKLIVHPDFQNRGIGSLMMRHVESEFKKARRFELFTGHKSLRNLHLYQKLGYAKFTKKAVSRKLTMVFLEKTT